MDSAVDSRAEESINRAASAMFELQRPDGSWPSRRPTAVLGTAGALVALHFADPERSRDLIERGARWVAGAQNADGGWGGVAGAATQLMPTVVAAAALRLVSPDDSREQVGRALELLEARGGREAFTDPAMAHLSARFLALGGLRDMPAGRRIPLELLLLPQRLWRRRLSFRTVPFIAMAFMQTPQDGLRRVLNRPATWAGLRVLDTVNRGEHLPGGYGGDNWLVALVCLGLVRAGAPRPVIADTVDYLRGNAHEDGSWHVMQGIDVIGGAYVARGLADAGYTDDPRLERARRWLRGCQQTEAFPVFDAPPGGWGWEGPRGWPNLLDSATVLSALAAAEHDEPLRRGLRWALSRQDRRGSWSTFVPDTTLSNDGPCPYATAQCVEVLLDSGFSRHDGRIRQALDWLRSHQRPDGTYPAMWYRGRTPGTAMALAAFSRAGIGDSLAARRARDALLQAQLANGSWGSGEPGEDAGTGTVEETAWALHALLTSGAPAESDHLRRAADWIMAAQRPEGGWEAGPICIYIRDFAHYVDGLIVNGLALRALGSYRSALAGKPLHEQATS